MIVLPISILLLSAGGIWIFRKTHIRIHWSIGLIGIGLAWIITYLLSSNIPSTWEVSHWKPESIFPTTILFRIDEISWPLCMGIISVLLTVILTRPSRKDAYNLKELIGILVYTSLLILSVMSKNIITTISIWIFMDGVIFMLFMLTDNGGVSNSKVITWNVKNIASSFLLIFAYVLNIAQNGIMPFSLEDSSTFVFLMIAVASLLRMPFLSFSSDANQIGWFDQGSRTILDLYPAITGFSLLGNLLNQGISENILLTMRIIGVFVLALSAILFVFSNRREVYTTASIIGLFGIGLIVETYSGFQPGLLIIMTGVLCLLIIPTLNFVRIYERWNLFFPITITVMLIGLPGSPGLFLARSIVEMFLTERAIGLSLLSTIGIMLIAVSTLQSSVDRKNEWASSDNLTRMSYFSGLVLFSLSGILIGLTSNIAYTLNDFLFFFLMVFIVGGLYLGLRKVRIDLPILQSSLSFPYKRITTYLEELSRSVMEIIRGSANLFEQETGMLWTFVILLLFVLAFVNLGL